MILFKGYDQFINWIPKLKDNGKMDKIPVDTSGKAINHLLPKNWISENKARNIGAITGFKTGFVFTDNDPFFFVDIDAKCKPATSKIIVSVFPGCAVETSQSGKGLHIFGTGSIKNHTHRNSVEDLELYTTKRFVALTGVDFKGDTATNGQVGLDWYAKTFFSEKSNDTSNWTTEPCADWKGDTDDGELIERANKAQSVAGKFGDKATFSQLFTNDNKLSDFYPSPSEMDAALCQHLAFWTGKDCERMEQIFNMSELGQREKWMNGDEYRQRTILNAVSICKAVYTRKVETNTMRAGNQFMDLEAQIKHFSGCVYVSSRHRVFVPSEGVVKPEVFKILFGGYDFVMKFEGRASKNAFEVFTESQLYKFPIVYGTCFRPEKAPSEVITKEGVLYVNTYAPLAIERKHGDSSRFLEFLEKILPDSRDRQIFLSYMAACVQYPGVKFQWAPLLQGTEGNGKTFLATAVSKAVGERYSHFPNATDLHSKFTGWLHEKLFIGIEEIFTNGRTELQEALKPFITNRKIEIQYKGADQFTGDNRANFMLFSNHKDGVRKTPKDRRYCVFYSAQQEVGDLQTSGMGGSYFPELYRWARDGGYAIITDYLFNYKIPDEFNPATKCHRAPETTSTKEAFRASLTVVEQEILEAIGEERSGFRGGWIASTALDVLLIEKHRKVSPYKRLGILKNLGYVKKGKMNRLEHGRRPTLYAIGSPQKLTDGAEIANAYLKAQEEQ